MGNSREKSSYKLWILNDYRENVVRVDEEAAEKRNEVTSPCHPAECCDKTVIAECDDGRSYVLQKRNQVVFFPQMGDSKIEFNGLQLNRLQLVW